MNMETYTILEYESFTREQDINHNSFKLLPKATFDKLKQFIIESKSFGDVDGLDIMSISHKKHIGEVITAKNYVGLIVLNDGTIIEILPKIANADESDTKRILLNMLRTLVELPFKTLSTANLDMAKLPLLEVFISMFIKEVDSLVKKGLKSEYLTYQANETALKGKLLFNNHLKYNFVHKERFFVEYHPYNINRAENKLIKTTLQYLYRLCRNAQNKKALVNLLNLFDDIDISKNIDVDFSNCSNTRDMRIYEQTLKWARIFLKGNSFTNLQGTHLATALLFPMEKLFESYVAEKLSNALNCTKFTVSAQDNSYYLFNKAFSLRPDIVIQDKESSKTIVMDTKWKKISKSLFNNGISQSDMYQMYAYGKKYNTQKTVLLYPQNPDNATDIEFDSYDAKEDFANVEVHIRILDLLDENCVDKIVKDEIIFC